MSLCLQPVDIKLAGWATSPDNNQQLPQGMGCGEGHLSIGMDDLTTVDLNGTGVFDCLMQATFEHLQEEYNAQRITGDDYANVYLQSIQNVLHTSLQYLINEQHINKIVAEIGLIRQKIASELALTDDSIPIGLAFNHYETNNCIKPVSCNLDVCDDTYTSDTAEGSIARVLEVDGMGAINNISGGNNQNYNYWTDLAEPTSTPAKPGCFTTFRLLNINSMQRIYVKDHPNSTIISITDNNGLTYNPTFWDDVIWANITIASGEPIEPPEYLDITVQGNATDITENAVYLAYIPFM